MDLAEGMDARRNNPHNPYNLTTTLHNQVVRLDKPFDTGQIVVNVTKNLT